MSREHDLEALQQDVEDTLTWLDEALQDEINRRQEEQDSPPMGGPQPQDQQLVPDIAQLKLLRRMELNVLEAGANYGWPVITYGTNYVIGTKIGEGTHKQGMEQPVHYWTPSIAPSGMSFYTGSMLKPWKDNLFVGSLKFQQLVRLELKGEKVVHEERMLNKTLGRIRDVRQGPDDLLYLLTDERKGKLVRIGPSSPRKDSASLSTP